jgi:mono/diheme cytochrome c family protein
LLAGCGGGGSAASRSGRQLFATDCSHCHSLTGHDSPSRQGGDLLNARFSRAVMLEFAREMPVRHPLTEAELRAVSDYVVAVERGGGG